jgi:hypothetical protein
MQRNHVAVQRSLLRLLESTDILNNDNEINNLFTGAINGLPNDRIFELHSLCDMCRDITLRTDESSWNLIVAMINKLIDGESSHFLYRDKYRNMMINISEILINPDCPPNAIRCSVEILFVLHCQYTNPTINIRPDFLPELSLVVVNRIRMAQAFNGENLIARLGTVI